MQIERADNAEVLLRWSNENGVNLDSELRTAIEDGFGATADGEDRFDAVVGLFGLLNIVLGRLATLPTGLHAALL
ncbi:MAG TPA: hypothetical protein VL334_04490 [Anaerolineae bacterium]|nr:hypothetical protein [Anaerolineae bacterium]